MTIIQEDFDFLDTTNRWYKYVPVGDIAVINGMAYSTGADNFLVYKAPGSLGITSSTVAFPVEVTFATAHGVANGSKFFATISGCDATISEFPLFLNGIFEVTATDTNKGTIQRTGTLAATTGTAYRHLSNASQKAEVLVACSSDGAGKFVILWNRYDPAAQDGLSIGVAGYGLKLAWEASGVRRISIVKVDTPTGLLVELGNKTVTLFSDQGADIGVLQRLKIITHDESAIDTDLPQESVVIRAYVNEDDDGKPSLEVKDYGKHTAGDTMPPMRAPGTFAISFGTVTNETLVDAVAMEYGYILPKVGVYGRGYSTRAELRRRVSRLVSVGGSNNYDETFLNEAIQDAVLECINLLGDKAFDLKKTVPMTLTAEADKLVTMSEDVGRVMYVWDAASYEPVEFSRKQTDSRGRGRYLIEPIPTDKAFVVEYVQEFIDFTGDTDLSPIPSKWDGVISSGAALRIKGEADGAGKFFNAMSQRWERGMAQYLSAMAQIARTRNPVMRASKSNHYRSRYGRLDLTGYNPFV